MKPLSPSQIAVEAAGVKPRGVLKARSSGVCAMCGIAHDAGELIAPFAPTDSFTDYGALADRASKFICQWCAATWTADFTQSFLKTVMCKTGVYGAASNALIAHWIQNPPEGPWIWVNGIQQRQHVVWKAPVNTSRDIFQVQFDEFAMTIRRAKVLEAQQAARRLAAAASAGRRGAPLKSPFNSLDRELKEVGHGRIRYDLMKMAETDPAIRADVDVLHTCTAGEVWALTAVLYAEPASDVPQYFPKAA